MLNSIYVTDIENIPSDIDQFYYAHIISISNGIVKVLPNELFNLKLLSLSLKNNDIIKLPRKIGELITLKFLDISHNKLRVLPKEILNLVYLTNIQIDGNGYMPTDLRETPINRFIQLKDSGYIK